MSIVILREPAVRVRLQVSKATLAKWRRRGIFPDPMKLGPRMVAWDERDVDAWLRERLAAARPVVQEVA